MIKVLLCSENFEYLVVAKPQAQFPDLQQDFPHMLQLINEKGRIQLAQYSGNVDLLLIHRLFHELKLSLLEVVLY